MGRHAGVWQHRKVAGIDDGQPDGMFMFTAGHVVAVSEKCFQGKNVYYGNDMFRDEDA